MYLYLFNFLYLLIYSFKPTRFILFTTFALTEFFGYPSSAWPTLTRIIRTLLKFYVCIHIFTHIVLSRSIFRYTIEPTLLFNGYILGKVCTDFSITGQILAKCCSKNIMLILVLERWHDIRNSCLNSFVVTSVCIM